MNEKIKSISLLVVLIIGTIGAVYLYNYLSTEYTLYNEIENDESKENIEIKNTEIHEEIKEEKILEDKVEVKDDILNTEIKKEETKDFDKKEDELTTEKVEIKEVIEEVNDINQLPLEPEVTEIEDKVTISENPTTDFSVTDINGNLVNLSNYFGKPIIVNFWATWCGPCKSELPAFNNMYKKYGEEINFLMVNLTDGFREKEDNVKEFISKNNYEFPLYFDKEFSASNAYSVYSIPMTLFINADGTLKDTRIGAMNEKTLEKYIKELKGEITQIIKFN